MATTSPRPARPARPDGRAYLGGLADAARCALPNLATPPGKPMSYLLSGEHPWLRRTVRELGQGDDCAPRRRGRRDRFVPAGGAGCADRRPVARVTPVARGDAMFTDALSEAGADSNAASRTHAVSGGDWRLISGAKTWIGNAGVSKHRTVMPGSRSSPLARSAPPPTDCPPSACPMGQHRTTPITR